MDAGRMANAPNRLTARVEIPAACGGRKPNKVKGIDEKLDMSLWLRVSADHAERADGQAIVREKARNNGVARPFVRGDQVGMSRVQ